mgnify:CR=1 FL=1
MSHVPLLAKQSVPKLQPPRRGPQVVCLCLLLGIVLLLVPSSAYTAVLGNATHSPPAEPPPEAVRRIMEFAKQQPFVHRFVGDDTQQDLVTAVSYLATRELQPR